MMISTSLESNKIYDILDKELDKHDEHDEQQRRG